MRVGVDVATEGKVTAMEVDQSSEPLGISTVVLMTEHGRKVRIVGTTKQLRKFAAQIHEGLTKHRVSP